MSVLAVLLRLVALLVCTELSGAAHAVLDVTASFRGDAHPDDDCDQEAGHECPPGCPNCHCTHGGVSLSAPRMEVRLRVLSPERNPAGFLPLYVSPPKPADLTPLYRPPRARATT